MMTYKKRKRTKKIEFVPGTPNVDAIKIKTFKKVYRIKKGEVLELPVREANKLVKGFADIKERR